MNLLSGLKATFLGHSDFSWENRRRHQRMRLRIPVRARQGEETHNAELLDLSSQGLRLLSPHSAQPGQAICLTAQGPLGLVGRQRVGCRVAWCRPQSNRFLVGVHWNDPDSWVRDLWHRVEPRWAPRKHLRIACQLDVQLTVEGEPQAWNGLCHDLSPGGCRLQVQAHLTPGQKVRLGFGPRPWDPTLVLEASVVRREGTEYNLRFGPYPCPRLRGLLLNLLEAQAPLCEDPLVDEEALLARAPAPMLAKPLVPRKLASVPAPNVPEPRFESGLPRVVGQLRLREVLPDRNPSVWAARNLKPQGLTFNSAKI